MSFTPLRNLVAAEGHHTYTMPASVQELSLPLHARGILMQAITQNIRYTLDGSTPTASSGYQLLASDPPLYIEITKGMRLRFLREASGAVLEYEYSA